MKRAGMPLTTPARKIFTDVVQHARLAYTSIIDFVPGVEAYGHETVVEMRPSESDARHTRVVQSFEPMHDANWTTRLAMGRTNEMENLERVVAARQKNVRSA